MMLDPTSTSAEDSFGNAPFFFFSNFRVLYGFRHFVIVRRAICNGAEMFGVVLQDIEEHSLSTT